ncbi:MAG: hypothetical protein AAGF47_03320 [Planctomycetota bacterium]
MSTSQHTINQVRSILGRLDRSIDEARQRRLSGDADPQRPPADSDMVIGDSDSAENAPPPPGRSPAPDAPPPPPVGPARSSPRAPSPFGRAKPLRRTGSDGSASSGWSTP